MLIPDYQFIRHLDEYGGAWIVGILFKRHLSNDEHDRAASNLNYGGAVGRPYQNYSHTKKTKKCTLLLARGGWDI